jgi:LPS sulfotransferase NodH
VVYEELVADYESTVRGVLGFLGVTSQQTVIPQPRSLKQSDAISEEWEERYRKLSAEAGI